MKSRSRDGLAARGLLFTYLATWIIILLRRFARYMYTCTHNYVFIDIIIIMTIVSIVWLKFDGCTELIRYQIN